MQLTTTTDRQTERQRQRRRSHYRYSAQRVTVSRLFYEALYNDVREINGNKIRRDDTCTLDSDRAEPSRALCERSTNTALHRGASVA